ncbi:C-C motif chemokine 25 [Camelus dromedarius]|uniref:C-C motif chemokine 25 n=1 Tax=Camelus dromedarius TaxID=9838 RepID=A0A5N4CK21_CAMDR|nr:C-C motif chemokine 25 [Camelus dromedarius]
MNPWLLVCLVACFMGAWAPAVHAQGTVLDHTIPAPLKPSLPILPVPSPQHRFLLQEPPLISPPLNYFSDRQLSSTRFFFPQKDRMVCGRPGARWVQIGMKILDARSKTHFKHHHGTWRNFQGE